MAARRDVIEGPALSNEADPDLEENEDEVGAPPNRARRYTDPFNRARAPSDGLGDTDMEAGHSHAPWRVTNAPTLPKAPVYSGRTLQARRTFMRNYETYTHALAAFEPTFSKPFVMPVNACIEMKTKRVIALYHFEKTLELITEVEWQSPSEMTTTPLWMLP